MCKESCFDAVPFKSPLVKAPTRGLRCLIQIVVDPAELKLEMDPLQHMKCSRNLVVDFAEE